MTNKALAFVNIAALHHCSNASTGLSTAILNLAASSLPFGGYTRTCCVNDVEIS
jgi:hypothetical protein